MGQGYRLSFYIRVTGLRKLEVSLFRIGNIWLPLEPLLVSMLTYRSLGWLMEPG